MSDRRAEVRRIAVLRCNALGDYLMATPALAALRAAFPGSEITLLGAAWHARFLAGRPGPVDRVLVVPRVGGLAGQPDGAPPASALPRWLEQARAHRYDLAVQLHGGGSASNPLMTSLRTGWSIGLRAADAAPLDATVPYRYYPRWSRWSAPTDRRSTRCSRRPRGSRRPLGSCCPATSPG